jgi:hypothetical protein
MFFVTWFSSILLTTRTAIFSIQHYKLANPIGSTLETA